jgi:hypothetical protein
MTWKKAIDAAPPEAEFVSYMGEEGRWIIINRLADGTVDVCASLNSIGYMTFAAGVSAQNKVLWSYDSHIFICGPLELMFRNMETEA